MGALSVAAAGDVTITVSGTTGSLSSYNSNATWASAWTSTQQNPGVAFTVYGAGATVANNISISASSTNIIYYVGKIAASGESVYSSYLEFAPTAGYYVSQISLDAALYGTATTVSIATTSDATPTALTSSTQHFSQTFEQGETAKLYFSGNNEGATLSNFTVVLSPLPATNTDIITTTISDNEFAKTTAWYHLNLTDRQYYLHYDASATGLALDQTAEDFSDEYLWCFIGDNTTGYKIYNKAAGTAKALAISGSTVQLAAGGTPIFITEVTGVESLTDVSNKYFASATAGGSSKLGAVSGKLGISTGSSANEALMINWAQQAYKIDATTGTLSRSDGGTSSWKNTWTSNEISNFTLSTAYNNWSTSDSNWLMATGQQNGAWTFAVPEGRRLAAFQLNAVLNEAGTDVTFTGNGGSAVLTVTSDVQTFSVNSIGNLAAYSFTVTGSGNKCAVVSDFYATMRRGEMDRGNAVDVFLCTTAAIGSSAYRIPAITCVENGVNKGRIIAVNDFRISGTSDIGSGRRIDLYISTSDDNGATWTAPGWALDASGNPVTMGEGTTEGESNSNNHWKCAFGDACIVSDRESGKVLMMAVGGPVGFFNSTRTNPNQLVRWYSSDGGTTWTEPECITEYYLGLFDENCPWGSIKGQFIGSGRMMQSHYIKNGDYYRVYAVSSVLYDSSATANYVMYSDDFGQTWNILGDPQIPAVYSAADEPKAEELPDGSVLLAARGRNGNRNFNIFRYTDIAAGEGQWDGYVNTNCGQGSINACDGDVMILPAVNNETKAKTYIALQTFPYGGGRNYVSIIYKSLNGYDDIKEPACFSTWEGRYQVSDMGSAYSTVCWQKNNTLGFLYEEETYGKTYNGVYVNLTLETITNGKYSYSEDTDGSVRQAITKSVIQGRLAAEVSTTEGIYVGQPNGKGNTAATAAAEAYAATPSYENYVAFNKAMIDGTAVATIQLKNNGVYRIISAHNGTYTFSNDKYLSCSNGALTSTEDVNDATEWLVYTKDVEAGTYVLYNIDSAAFVGNTPEIYTEVPTSSEASAAGLYTIESSIEGYSNFTCTSPTNSTYPALHLNGSANIVTWTTPAAASQWYMLYLRDGSSINPEGLQSSLIDTNAAATAPVTYYDMMGRRVDSPVSGRIYITSDRKKVLF